MQSIFLLRSHKTKQHVRTKDRDLGVGNSGCDRRQPRAHPAGLPRQSVGNVRVSRSAAGGQERPHHSSFIPQSP